MSGAIRLYVEPSGQIIGYDNCDPDAPPIRDGLEFIVVEVEDLPDAKRSVFDHATSQIRDMTDEERRLFNAPSLGSLMLIRSQELLASDWREFRGQAEADWTEYRQKLRDITQAGDVLQMMDAWPLRPDGTDAIAQFKAHLQD